MLPRPPSWRDRGVTYTARTPIVLRSPRANLLFSIRERTRRLAPSMSPVTYRSILMSEASRGSRCVMFAWIPVSQEDVVMNPTYKPREQRVRAEGSALSFIVTVEDDEDIFHLADEQQSRTECRVVLTVTIIVRDQIMTDSTPMRSSWEGSSEKVEE